MGSMKGKQSKIDAALGRLADMMPSGNLLANTDPVGFLDTVAAELKELRAERESMKTCTWAEDTDGNWHTECQEMHIFISGTPQENWYVYCPYCGGCIQIRMSMAAPGREEDEQ